MTPIEFDGFPGRIITHMGQDYLYFGGTAYLGVQTLTKFQSIFERFVQEYGTNYGASRNSNVQLEIYSAAESYLSEWLGSEASLTMSSGYLAGQLLAHYFRKNEYASFYAPLSHSALYSTNDQVFKDWGSIRESLLKFLADETERTPVIFLDAVDLSSSTFPDFKGLRSLPIEKCILVADDSHGIGLVGPNGTGSFDMLKSLKPKELLICCSMGKALGLQAGAVFGEASRLSDLRNTAIYSGASPAAPASLATLMEALPIYESQRSILESHINHFLNNVDKPERFRFLENYPVFAYEDKKFTEFLFDHRIIVTDFNYSADEISWQSRIVISGCHKAGDIGKLVEVINKYTL